MSDHAEHTANFLDSMGYDGRLILSLSKNKTDETAKGSTQCEGSNHS